MSTKAGQLQTVTELPGGNLKINDHADKIFADDSTDVLGSTTFRIRSFSGCGTIKLNFFVSGIAQGDEVITVRTTDTNADGRTDGLDSPPCDLDYDGITNMDSEDLAMLDAHDESHWHRNVLHGTPVQRSSFCITCPLLSPNTHGDSKITWAPDGRKLALSIHIDSGDNDCALFTLPSDPEDGNNPTQFTFPVPNEGDDYDPSWSPLGDEIIFTRADNTIYRKGIPGLNPDTSLVLVTTSGSGVPGIAGDLNPSVSPNGTMVAFVRALQVGGNKIFTIPIEGGTPTQLTFTASTNDNFPEWSPDGESIIFHKFSLLTGRLAVYKVPAAGGPESLVFEDPTTSVRQPSVSSDGLVGLTGLKTGAGVNTHVPITFDLSLSTPPGIKNYEEFLGNPNISARQSPDGTRLAFVTQPPESPTENVQIWAVRRNMNLPPLITALGAKTIGEDTVTVHFTAVKSELLTLALTATDPEGDPITCSAFFLNQHMNFNSSTCTFTWRPKNQDVGKTFNVKFHVATLSGGSDFVIAQITVTAGGGGGSAPIVATLDPPNLQNPSRGPFALATPVIPGVIAKLEVYNVAGRLVSRIEGRAGSFLIWNGRDRQGWASPPGVYLYLLQVGNTQKKGKFVLVR